MQSSSVSKEGPLTSLPNFVSTGSFNATAYLPEFRAFVEIRAPDLFAWCFFKN